MADDDDTDRALRAEVATLFYEMRLAFEAAAQTFNRFLSAPAAAAMLGELGVRLRLPEEDADALISLDGVMDAFLKRHAVEGGSNG